MSATPALRTLASAATTLRLAGHTLAADAVVDARLQFAALLDAADDKLAEIDERGHGLTDTPADRALRAAVAGLRPSTLPCLG